MREGLRKHVFDCRHARYLKPFKRMGNHKPVAIPFRRPLIYKNSLGFGAQISEGQVLDRRHVLGGLGGLIGLWSLPLGKIARAGEAPLASGLPDGLYDTATLEALPGKRPLIRLTTRPPNYETPQSYFSEPVTPNDAFFVRYHLSTIPRV